MKNPYLQRIKFLKKKLAPLLEEKKKWKSDFLFKQYHSYAAQDIQTINEDIKSCYEMLKKISAMNVEQRIPFNHLKREGKWNFLPIYVPVSKVTPEMMEKEEEWYNSNKELFH